MKETDLQGRKPRREKDAMPNQAPPELAACIMLTHERWLDKHLAVMFLNLVFLTTKQSKRLGG